MQLFVRPVEIPVEFQQHQGISLLKQFLLDLIVVASVLHGLNECSAHFRADAEVRSEVERDKLAGIQAADCVVHLVLLDLRKGKGFFVILASLELRMDELMDELVHHSKFLLVCLLPGE